MWQLLCAKNRHAHATRQCDRHGIQLGEDPLTTCRQPPCCSWWPRARCSHGGACTLCPSARSKVSRCSAALCMLGRCSNPSQVLGAVGRCIRLGAGASCTIRKHSACSHRPPRTALHMHPPTPAEHMQCVLRKCAFNSSEQHDRHAIQPTEHLPTTCRQPPCCSRCSVLAAAMTPHAHHAPSGSM